MNPPFTLEERELMQSIGGTAGYLKVCDNRLRAERPELFVERTLEAMFAYELAGSEEGARELLKETLPAYAQAIDRKIETIRKFHALDLLPKSAWDDLLREDAERAAAQPAAYVCPKCGALDCTKNHAEFM